MTPEPIYAGASFHTIYNAVKTKIKHPFGNGLYHLFIMKLGMIHYCFIHILLYSLGEQGGVSLMLFASYLPFKTHATKQPTNLHSSINPHGGWTGYKWLYIPLYPRWCPIKSPCFCWLNSCTSPCFGSQKSPFPVPQWKSFSWVYQVYIFSLPLSIHRHLVECYCQRQGRECEHQTLWLAKHPFLEENHIENP